MRVRLPVHCRVRLTKGRGAVVLGRAGPFHNLVVNNGLNGLASATFDALVNYCTCGTGSNEVTAGDENLQTFVASTNTVVDSAGATQAIPPYYSEYVQTFRFPAGTFSGQQISEIGFSNQATDGNLFSRALVQVPDRFGGPTLMQIRSDEWLDVTYEFRLYPDFINADGSLNDGAGLIEVGGSLHAYTIRPANVTNIDYWSAQNTLATFVAVSSAYATSYGSGAVLGLVTDAPSSPSGTAAYTPDSEISAAPYTSDTFERDLYLQIGPNDCNATGGIGALRFHTGMGAYQMAFDPVIPKDSGNTWNFVLNLAWANAVL